MLKMSQIPRVNAKLGNMKKVEDFTVCPVSNNTDPNVIYIQSKKRIATVNVATGKATLSSGKGSNGFIALSPALGAVEVDVPAELVQELKTKCAGLDLTQPVSLFE